MHSYELKRRGFDHGSITDQQLNKVDSGSTESNFERWHSGKPLLLNQLVKNQLKHNEEYIRLSETLYQQIISGADCDELLSKEPYHSRIAPQFEALGSAFNEGLAQEIQTVYFDAIVEDNTLAEDLWIKVSRLSFFDEEASLRLRFSFGVDFEEDVASDQTRQHYASLLTDAVFPESNIIVENQNLNSILHELLGVRSVEHVERIVYFNAPNGGAYLHHDRERGHEGVVYAQLTGMTFWIALPRKSLLIEIVSFLDKLIETQAWPSNLSNNDRVYLTTLSNNAVELENELESFANNSLISLINETAGFTQHLIQHGYGKILRPGDVMLLPQNSAELCCWHSVFCLGADAGQALSFAIREGSQ